MFRKSLSTLGLVALTSFGFGLGALPALANPSPFGQQEVDQTKYVVMAMPLAMGGYKLFVLEQVSNKRPCWAENGTNPTVIDPLLTTFDFTGICGRSMDSNGYSIRVEQQDLGLQYSLSIEQGNNELLLVGVANRGGPKMILGRTNGMVPGAFLKFNLDPTWRLTRRTFESRVLGHVYFTANSMQAAISEPAPAIAAPATAEITPGPETPMVPSQSNPNNTTEANPSGPGSTVNSSPKPEPQAAQPSGRVTP